MEREELQRRIEAAVLALKLCPLERTLVHYSSLHRILLVGEGDFSFSSALATAFGCLENIVATSLDSKEKVLRVYKSASISISNLERRGASVLHEVNATRLHQMKKLKRKRFDRIVFNLPHAGFFRRESEEAVIKMNSELVSMFFQSATNLLSLMGEIHVAHKVGFPYDNWNLVEEAEKCGLFLKESVHFKIADYPGYANKRGDGALIDESFPLGECKTYKFMLKPDAFIQKELLVARTLKHMTLVGKEYNTGECKASIHST